MRSRNPAEVAQCSKHVSFIGVRQLLRLLAASFLKLLFMSTLVKWSQLRTLTDCHFCRRDELSSQSVDIFRESFTFLDLAKIIAVNQVNRQYRGRCWACIGLWGPWRIGVLTEVLYSCTACALCNCETPQYIASVDNLMLFCSRVVCRGQRVWHPAPATRRQETLFVVRLAVVRHCDFLDGRLRWRLSWHMAEQTVHDDTHRNCHYRITVSGLYMSVCPLVC